MLASLSVIVSLAVLPFVNAQADNNLGVKAIEAHFDQSHITEDYLDDFAPVATLDLNFEGVGAVTPGQRLSAAESRPQPAVTVTPANSSVTLDGAFTIAMFDINTVGEELPNGPTRHWLLNGVTLDGNTVSNATATAITAYAGPGPAAGSGAHRYIIALFQQPADFAAPEGFQEPTGVEPMDFKAYIENTNLELVAANYIIVEEGTASASAVSTAPVNSATLAAGGSSGSSSGGVRPTGVSSSNAPESTDADGSAAKVSTWAASAVALFGGLAVLAL
ncbi:phosphatidylethanolamine-binding protein [Coprinopsis sp. MPI-PUGE-AT-0042]|nr:phosphatidylethanolamine-binding protein [Coprinopsis sp. MPI-PUGE-AT-0042]